MSDDVLVEDRGPVRWITLNRPESKNGLTVGLAQTIAEACRDAGRDRSVRTVVLAGAGGAFCSGLDLKDAMRNMGQIDPNEGLARFQNLVRAVWDLMKPVLAAIDGPAAGFGADLALACDYRLASERARLGERFVRIGLMPDGGGTWLLPRLVGTGVAFELLYSGRMVEAEEGKSLGLFNRVLPVDGFEDAVHEEALRLAQGPPLAYARIKRAVRAGLGDLDIGLAAEGEGQLVLLGTSDFAEGVQAFLGKRDPAFTGD